MRQRQCSHAQMNTLPRGDGGNVYSLTVRRWGRDRTTNITPPDTCPPPRENHHHGHLSHCVGFRVIKIGLVFPSRLSDHIAVANTYVVNDVAWFVCLVVRSASPAKTAEPIKLVFGVRTLQGDGQNRVFGGGLEQSRKGAL